MNAPVAMSSVLAIRAEAEHAPESGIVEVANYARGRDGLIPLYVGEGDLSTPAFICEAATRALAAGETFYTWQRGIPDLRQALARYHERLYRRPSDPERFFVTIGGMHALQTAVRMIAGAGDEVVIPTPAWPNFAGALSVVGARVAQVPMTSAKAGWQLDLDRLDAAVTARTRAIVVNSPANPTGWTASARRARRDPFHRAAARAVDRRRRDLCPLRLRPGAHDRGPRAVLPGRHGAAGPHPVRADLLEELGHDRLAHRLARGPGRARPGDREPDPVFDLGRAGVPCSAPRSRRSSMARASSPIRSSGRGAAAPIVCDGLLATGAVDLPPPPGAFYAFLKVKGVSDARSLALRLVDEANVGLAPGTAFGDGGQGYLRLCFARKSEDLEEAVRRLAAVLRA